MYIRYSREKLQEKNKIPHFLQLWDKSSQENKNWRPEGVFTLFRINTLYVNTECLCLSFVNIYFLYCRGSGKILNFLWFGFPYFSSLNWTVNRAERERPLCSGDICIGGPGEMGLNCLDTQHLHPLHSEFPHMRRRELSKSHFYFYIDEVKEQRDLSLKEVLRPLESNFTFSNIQERPSTCNTDFVHLTWYLGRLLAGLGATFQFRFCWPQNSMQITEVNFRVSEPVISL